MQNKWISIKDKLPESGQQVLIYWYDEPYEVHQVHLLSYFKKGDVMDISVDYTEESPDNKIKALEDGFYLYDGNWRKHADIITHWMPLPEFPKKECSKLQKKELKNRR